MKTSLAHLPLFKKQELKRLKSIILAKAPQTQFIILFGSHARGDWVEDEYTEGHITYTYQSDFDILVITDDKKTARNDNIWMQAEDEYYGIRPSQRTPLDIISHHLREVNDRLREGHYFFSDIKKEGVLLYTSGNYRLERKRKIDPVRRLEIAMEDFEQWFESANEFFDDFIHNFDLKRYKKAAFELHQATERFYKAAILTRSGYSPRTHNIAKLGRMIASDYPEFKKIFPRQTEEEKQLFRQLKNAYVDARYKKTYRISREELEYLAERVQKLRDLVETTCKNIITDLKQQVRQ
ncbi:MAG: HEPN domain-containing protein [Victivallales bacterium]|nr:HEPN domain-containing protein [Victivallales bacterium]